MNLYIVDNNFLKTVVIDIYDSLIWTERYNASGDVTLTLPDNPDTRAMITEGIFLNLDESQEIMLIDTILIENGMIIATGNSLVDFFKQRMMRGAYNSTIDSWNTSTNPAGTIANSFVTIFTQAGTFLTGGSILSSAQGTNEIIPKLSLGAATSGPALTFSIPYGNLYDTVKTVCDGDNLGFTMYPPSTTDGTGNLLFKTYRGLDRTTSQTVNEQVIFESALDTFTDVKELRSIAGYKNVAWVFPSGATSQSQVGVAYAPGAQALSSWNRRTLMVAASDIDATAFTAAALQTILTQKGQDALVNNNYIRMLDGQLVPQNAFVYGTDYNLGDIVELRGSTNMTQNARITEYIRAQDSTGERSYPTLSVIL